MFVFTSEKTEIARLNITTTNQFKNIHIKKNGNLFHCYEFVGYAIISLFV